MTLRLTCHIELLADLHQGSLQLGRINYPTNILVPTKIEARTVRELISLLNCSVKITTKILANRMRIIIGDLVDNHQIEFIARRSILEVMATAQKVMLVSKKTECQAIPFQA